MITRFKGESRMAAIANHFSLDIDEEKHFLDYITTMGYTIDASDEIIESLVKMWEENVNK